MNTTVSKNTVKVYTTLDKTFVEALCGKFTDSQPKEKRIVFEVLNQEKEMLQADCIISGGVTGQSGVFQKSWTAAVFTLG